MPQCTQQRMTDTNAFGIKKEKKIPAKTGRAHAPAGNIMAQPTQQNAMAGYQQEEEQAMQRQQQGGTV